jgi:hypothetical protein
MRDFVRILHEIPVAIKQMAVEFFIVVVGIPVGKAADFTYY